MIFTLLFQQQAQAQFYSPNVPVNAVSKSIGLTIRQAFVNAGLSGTNAGIIAAQAKIAQFMGSTAAKIVVGSVAAIASPSIAGIAGTLIVGAILNVAIDKGMSWLMNSDGTVTTNKPSTTTSVSSSAKAFAAGSTVFQLTVNSSNTPVFGSGLDSMIAAAQGFLRNSGHGYGKNDTLTNCTTPDSEKNVNCDDTYTNNYNETLIYRGLWVIRGGTAPQGCPDGQYLNNGSCQPDPSAAPTTTTTNNTSTGSMQSAITALTPEEKAQPLDPATIANMINAMGQQIQTDPTYTGPPIPPITPDTVKQATQGLSPPTVGDMVAPITPSSVQYDPTISPTSTNGATNTPFAPAASTTPTTSSTPTVKVDFGPDPGIGKPDMESVPTASMILSPILNMLPGFKTWTVPTHSGVCPVAEFDAFNRHYVMNSQCTIFEQIRPYFTPISIAAWTVLSIVIFLGA